MSKPGRFTISRINDSGQYEYRQDSEGQWIFDPSQKINVSKYQYETEGKMQQIDKEGRRRGIESYNAEKLLEHLNNPDVKEVAVFNLEKGMEVEIQGEIYEVAEIRSRGRISLKYLRPKETGGE